MLIFSCYSNFLCFPNQNEIGACIIFKTKRIDHTAEGEIKQTKNEVTILEAAKMIKFLQL